MLVRKFIQWSENAPAAARADGVGALARAYLYSDMSETERAEAEQTLFAMLDDPSPLARRALAESFASAVDAPPAIVLGLACDQSDISTIVLSRSPLLTDSELIDCAAISDSAAQAAIALRPDLSAAVSAALAEIGAREALIALAVNDGANLPEFAMRRMIERFGHDGEMREALLGRPNLPGAIRAALAAAAARQLTDFVSERKWLSRARSERLAKDSCDRATMIVAAGCAEYSGETVALAAYLRQSGQLTAGLALRALLCGQTGLFEAALAELTGLGPRRVAGLRRDPASHAFAALYAKAGLPPALFLAFRTALEALARHGRDQDEIDDGALRLPIVQAVLDRCEAADDENLGRLIALLRRFEADAARDTGKRGLERLRREGTPAEPQTATEIAPETGDAAPLAAYAEPRLADQSAPPAPEIEIFVDLEALEKELMAA